MRTYSDVKTVHSKIPFWITAINLIVIVILSFQVYAGLANPSMAYGAFQNIEPNRQAILSLVGRNIVMIIITIAAIFSKNAVLLRGVFVMNFCRELFDMVLVGYLSHFSPESFIWMSSFLLFLIPYLFAYRKLSQIKHTKIK
jgi:hypothetical protein